MPYPEHEVGAWVLGCHVLVSTTGHYSQGRAYRARDQGGRGVALMREGVKWGTCPHKPVWGAGGIGVG